MKKTEQETPDFLDPLSGLTEAPKQEAEVEKIQPNKRKSTKNQKGPSKKLFQRKKKNKGQILRIEDVEARLQAGEDVPVDEIVSVYMPRRKIKLFGAALLRMDKLRLFLLAGVLFIAGLFILSFMQEKMGNFTINLDRLELYRKGIAISADGDFTGPTAQLVAEYVEDATNITWSDIPDDVNDVEGGHNGRNYMAYTYYVRNAGKEDVAYNATVYLESCAKGAEDAVRVAVWRNDDLTIYAAPALDGEPEDNCTSFESEKIVCTYHEDDFQVGYVDKYTIVIYMEGEDPECVDKIVGGSVEFIMKITADDDDETSLLYKFIEDIVDTLNDDKSIDAAGTESPSYYNSGEVTWDTRRNKDNVLKAKTSSKTE